MLPKKRAQTIESGARELPWTRGRQGSSLWSIESSKSAVGALDSARLMQKRKANPELFILDHALDFEMFRAVRFR